MQVIRYTESLSQPNDTMFVEIDHRYRFTRRGKDWAKFREDLVELLGKTISDEMAEAFKKEAEDWDPADA